ncbi:MAG: class I SAM-dependent methyltransferase [Candidatus Pacebacteria bacterium]|jgi:ubiquinone/menaquinone biosynthesis C-methylase UbiE|nr:class I SAM-dependent methyltransferase [Candidatus Paceibacterota bacterium]
MEEIEKENSAATAGNGGLINQDKIISQLGVKDGMIIADLGCGAGYFTIPIAKMLHDTGQVYAVDVLTAALESVVSQAKLYGLLNVYKKRANVEVIGGTGIDSGKIDLVVMANILFQCQDRDTLFQEAKRILAPGGRIAVIDWIPNNAAMGPKYERCISEETAKKIAIKNGLKVVQGIRAGETHYGFVLELV